MQVLIILFALPSVSALSITAAWCRITWGILAKAIAGAGVVAGATRRDIGVRDIGSYGRVMHFEHARRADEQERSEADEDQYPCPQSRAHGTNSGF